MKLRLQFGECLLALGMAAALAAPCAAEAQRGRNNFAQQRPAKPANPPRAQQPRPQAQRPNAYNPPRPNRPPVAQQRPPVNQNRSAPPPQRPQTNQNRPATPPPSAQERLNRMSPEERQRLAQAQRKFNQLPPQKQQEVREAARNWSKLTPEQQNHIKIDVLPKWKQLPPERQKAISQRLGVLQNMPESARNQHLNDPNFTRGMSEEDKGTLRDLSHMHMGGAPEPPGE
jgi:hypothetical protein